MLSTGIKNVKKKVFCSIANQEPLKATGDFIFHQAIFQVLLVLYLFYIVLHNMQFCLIASKCTVASLSPTLYHLLLQFMLHDLLKKKCFLNCIHEIYVYCKLYFSPPLLFFPPDYKKLDLKCC